MTIFAADDPRGDCEELEEGGFFSGVPLHVVDFDPPHPLTGIPTAGGVASAAAAQPRIGAAGGVAASQSLRGLVGGTDTGWNPTQRGCVEWSLGMYPRDTRGLAN